MKRIIVMWGVSLGLALFAAFAPFATPGLRFLIALVVFAAVVWFAL